MLEYSTFGLAPDPSDQKLAQLRQKIRNKLQAAPLADPHRCTFGGTAIARELIDEYNVLTFPGILFESLPIRRVKKYGEPMRAFMDHPSKREESFDMLKPQPAPKGWEVNDLAGFLGATLFRIFKSMKDIEWERDGNYTTLIPKTSETFLNPKEHWISNISATGGASSPNMCFRSKRMMVADVLMNLAYPAEKSYTFGLKRNCHARNCINPAHYIQSWRPKPVDYPEIEEMAFGYHLAIGAMRGPGVKPVPKYFFDSMKNEATFTGSWKEYLDGAEEFWHHYEARMPTQDQGTLPTEPSAVLTLLAPQEAPQDKNAGPQLGDLFKAMGGRWGKE